MVIVQPLRYWFLSLNLKNEEITMRRDQMLIAIVIENNWIIGMKIQITAFDVLMFWYGKLEFSKNLIECLFECHREGGEREIWKILIQNNTLEVWNMKCIFIF